MNDFERLTMFEAAMREARSATAALEAWCGGGVTAERIAIDMEMTPVRLTQAGLRYRRVRLHGGGLPLVDADNRYDETCLTTAMRAELEKTAAPFGRVVGGLTAQRVAFGHVRLWNGRGDAPLHVLAIRAVLTNHEGLIFCEVHEFYRREILRFAPKTTS